MTARVPIGSLRTPEEIRRALLGLFESLKKTDLTITEVDGTSTAYTDAKSVADRAYADSQDNALGVVAAAYADAQDDLHSADDRGYTDAHITDVSAAHAASAVSFDGSLLTAVSQTWHPTSIDDVQDSLVTLIAEIDGRIEAGDVDAIIDAINGWTAGDSQLSNPDVFQTGLIVADAIAAGAIVAGKLASNSVEAANIVAGSVDGTHINAASDITIGSGATTWEIVGTGATDTTRIATSNATWANSAGVWLDASGRVRLKDKFEFDGTDLTVNGNINADAFTLRTPSNEKTFEFTMESWGGGFAPSTVPSLLMWDDNTYVNAMRMTWFYSKANGQFLRLGSVVPASDYTVAALVVDVDTSVAEISLDADNGWALITAGLNGTSMTTGSDTFRLGGSGTANLSTRLNVTGKLSANGGIDGLTSANGGIAGSNYDITGVNQMTINDEGEGIAWPNVTMYQEPGDTDRLTLNGNLLLKATAGPNITIRDTNSSDATGFISFENNAGTRMGFIGYPNNDDIHLKNENTGGQIYLSTSNATRMTVASNGTVTIPGQLSCSHHMSDGNTTYFGANNSWEMYLNTAGLYPYVDNGAALGSTSRYWNGVYSKNWFRSHGTTGWYNETYGEGIYATQTGWTRTYPGDSGFIASSTVILGTPSNLTTSSGSRYIRRSNTYGTLHTYTSTRDYKENVQTLPAEEAGRIIDLLRPVTFLEKYRSLPKGGMAKGRPDESNETDAERKLREWDVEYGFIAEEVDALEPLGIKLTEYDWNELNEDDLPKPVGWKDTNFTAVLVAEVKELRKRVAQLEAQA